MKCEYCGNEKEWYIREDISYCQECCEECLCIVNNIKYSKKEYQLIFPKNGLIQQKEGIE